MSHCIVLFYRLRSLQPRPTKRCSEASSKPSTTSMKRLLLSTSLQCAKLQSQRHSTTPSVSWPILTRRPFPFLLQTIDSLRLIQQVYADKAKQLAEYLESESVAESTMGPHAFGLDEDADATGGDPDDGSDSDALALSPSPGDASAMNSSSAFPFDDHSTNFDYYYHQHVHQQRQQQQQQLDEHASEKLVGQSPPGSNTSTGTSPPSVGAGPSSSRTPTDGNSHDTKDHHHSVDKHGTSPLEKVCLKYCDVRVLNREH